MSRFRQIDGEGEVWKEPPGPEIPDLDGEEFEDVRTLDVGDELPLIEAVLEAMSMVLPWEAHSELDVSQTQKLATRLKPLDWEAVTKRGIELGDDEESTEELWERFRYFVVDAARSCNAIEWELDDD